jgi:hypothetical protein
MGYGRISEYGTVQNPPPGWTRSKRDNLTKKCARARITVFRHPDGSRYEGMYGVMWVRSGEGSEPQYHDERYSTESEALDQARHIIYTEDLE